MKNVVLFLGCFLTIGQPVFSTPKKVVAGPESTVYGIAYEHGIPTRSLIAANNLKPPYVLKPGQVIIIPSPNEHVVGQGETLKSIAEDYGVKVDVLAQENNGQAIRPGEQLSIPSRDTESLVEALKPPSHNISTSSLDPLPSVKVAPVAGMKQSPQPSSSPSRTLPSDLAEEIAREKGGAYNAKKTDENVAKPMLMGNLTQGNAGAPTAATTPLREDDRVEKPKPKKEKITEKKEKKTVVKKEEDLEDKKHPQFIRPLANWPGKEGIRKANDGVNIVVPEGSDVRAAAAGDVLYAGSELKNFGKLLLLKHKDGWVTAYAYNSSLLVKKGDRVKQGQIIAKSGKTGDAKEPQLHFEVRKGKQPVDPLAQLES